MHVFSGCELLDPCLDCLDLQLRHGSQTIQQVLCIPAVHNIPIKLGFRLQQKQEFKFLLGGRHSSHSNDHFIVFSRDTF
eukprot:3281378-Amphidinium_carterae.1